MVLIWAALGDLGFSVPFFNSRFEIFGWGSKEMGYGLEERKVRRSYGVRLGSIRGGTATGDGGNWWWLDLGFMSIGSLMKTRWG